jgi:hypothetical protein
MLGCVVGTPSISQRAPAAGPIARGSPVEKPLTHPFFTRAVSWLRNTMNLSTAVLPGDAIGDPQDPSRARIDGYLDDSESRSFASLAIVSLVCAGVIALAASRPGLSPTQWTLTHYGSITLAICGFVGLIVEVRRARMRRLEVAVIVLAGDAAARIEPEHLERWQARPDQRLWLVSEAGLPKTSMARARELGMRCFMAGEQGISERV